MDHEGHIILSLFHILVVATLFLFIGFQRSLTPDWVFHALLAIGFVVLFFHGFKFFTRLRIRSDLVWINAFHFFFVAPLLLYVGYHGKDTPQFAYELLLILGFGALGYHLYRVVPLCGGAYNPTPP
jgi:hypothetical protein